VHKKEFPQVFYYDQDFVDVYDRSWAWMNDFWRDAKPSAGINNPFYAYKEERYLSLYESCMASFFLVYFNKKYPVHLMLDNFYSFQEDSGAIRDRYDLESGKPIIHEKNSEGLAPPLLAWTEFNLYHKVGVKKRVREVISSLIAYHGWIEKTFKDENGLYAPPLKATLTENSPREGTKYPLDFNAQMAINALYMSALADILNDKELGFRFKRQYFSLKIRINTLMWDPVEKFYYDLDENNERIKVKTVAAFWPLLAEIPNEDRAEKLVEHLQNPKVFGTENPFPTLAADEDMFDENGRGFRGSVIPFYTYMVIKGLEKYQKYGFAREASIRHLYFVLDAFHPDESGKGTLWYAYKPFKEGPAQWMENSNWNRPLDLACVGLSTIALMIENIVGLYMSLPRKTVDWFVPTLELMGIEELPLKRNLITIVSNKTKRGWEIRLESEKLYYFSIHLLDKGKKKTLPIPSGKCSMLIDKL